jgi:hypothetical protein
MSTASLSTSTNADDKSEPLPCFEHEYEHQHKREKRGGIMPPNPTIPVGTEIFSVGVLSLVSKSSSKKDF